MLILSAGVDGGPTTRLSFTNIPSKRGKPSFHTAKGQGLLNGPAPWCPLCSWRRRSTHALDDPRRRPSAANDFGLVAYL